MPWLNFVSPYNSILKYIKSKGIRVYHRSMPEHIGGEFDASQVIITINKEFRATEAGCGILCHEYQHFIDWREGKFKPYFTEQLLFNKENFQLVIDAETSAILGANKFLKMWGLKGGEFNAQEKQELIDFVLKYYFDQE